ncbi:hypothetical protein [Deinococcus sonorensis]|uniref:Uncharacterized protein n=1 Tax=Deinococcus sonorensis TaxID=309891 RepID=A0ABV8Y878_9DEIO
MTLEHEPVTPTLDIELPNWRLGVLLNLLLPGVGFLLAGRRVAGILGLLGTVALWAAAAWFLEQGFFLVYWIYGFYLLHMTTGLIGSSLKHWSMGTDVAVLTRLSAVLGNLSTAYLLLYLASKWVLPRVH